MSLKISCWKRTHIASKPHDKMREGISFNIEGGKASRCKTINFNVWNKSRLSNAESQIDETAMVQPHQIPPKSRPSHSYPATYPEDVQVLPDEGGLLGGRLAGLCGRRAGQQRAERSARRLVLLQRLRLTAQREGDVVICQPPAVPLVHLDTQKTAASGFTDFRDLRDFQKYI